MLEPKPIVTLHPQGDVNVFRATGFSQKTGHYGTVPTANGCFAKTSWEEIPCFWQPILPAIDPQYPIVPLSIFPPGSWPGQAGVRF